MATREQKKIIRDPIHGSIELDPVLVKIIDTPWFQRLRRIKQMGGGCFVYPGAVHTRFDHSIGVCHIAGELLKELDGGVHTDTDILCVQIAALSHDLGHGPFSHVYDTLLEECCLEADIHDQLTERQKKLMKHEHRSAEIVKLLLEKLWGTEEFKKAGLDKEKHLKFIQKMITFDKDLKDNPDLMKTWSEEDMGCTKEKCYLFEIVANGHTGIDVDKMDYFARDSHGLGLPNRFDWRRFAQVARVIEVPELGYRRLCTRDKEADNLYELFHTRYVLHRNAYQHKTKCIVEYMIREALKGVNDYIRIKGRKPILGCVGAHSEPTPGCADTHSEPILSCWEDMDAFQLLDDTIVDVILKTEPHAKATGNEYITIVERDDDKLKTARERLRRVVETHKLPKFIGKEPKEKVFPSGDKQKMEPEKEKAMDILVSDVGEDAGKEDYLILEVVTFNYGKKDKNPMLEHYFYTKHYPDHPFTLSEEEVSKMLPKAFQEELVFWYYDTYKHTKKEKREDEEQAEKARNLLWERLNTDRLPVPLHHTLRALYEQRRALRAAGCNQGCISKNLRKTIKEQEEIVKTLRETYRRKKN